MNLTTLEQSQKLKEWGAPQYGTEWAYYVTPGNSVWCGIRKDGDVALCDGLATYGCAAYDLESLIEWLKEKNLGMMAYSSISSKWWCSGGAWIVERQRYEFLFEADSLVEAVYALAEKVYGKEGK